MLKSLILQNRSYRRFDGAVPMTREALTALIDLARQTPSAGNLQPLRYRPVVGEACAAVYPCLGWAAALPDWDGPAEAERPTGYIVICCEKALSQNPGRDVGIAAQTILLAAVEAGWGGCMLGSVRRPQLAEALGLDTERYSIELVIALGKPVEEVRLVPLPESGDIRYYRDENGTHYVPKRSLEDVLL